MSFLPTAIKQFLYYKSLADRTFEQLPDAAFYHQPNVESNSIATIILHIYGNMLSRFTDFLTSDGEKSWRNRDEEFNNLQLPREVLMEKWELGWNTLLDTLRQLDEKDLETIVYIRNEGHTVMEAIIRQLTHYPYHVGQIIYIGKLWLDSNWVSLSIPRNQSKEYNENKFNQPKQIKHFTDDYIHPPTQNNP